MLTSLEHFSHENKNNKFFFLLTSVFKYMYTFNQNGTDLRDIFLTLCYSEKITEKLNHIFFSKNKKIFKNNKKIKHFATKKSA